MNDFTMYTYNKKAPMMGLDIGPVMALGGLALWQPPDDSPTVPQPHNSHLVYI